MYLIAVYPVPGIAPKTLARQISTALSQQDLRVLTGQDRGLAEFTDAASQSTSLVPLSGASGG
jgi:hypothetical protein